MMRHNFLVATITTSLLAAGPALAGNSNNQNTSDSSNQSSSQSSWHSSSPWYSSNFQGNQQTLQGTLTGFRTANLQSGNGSQDSHSLARLQESSGRTVVLDLGPKRDLDRVNLQSGDRVQVTGHFDTISGERVFLANQLQINGITLAIQQPTDLWNRSSAMSQNEGQQGENLTLSGKVQGYEVYSIGTGNQTSALLNLQLQNGRSILVGTENYQPGELDLRQLNLGDEVRIQAHRTSNSNPDQYVADSIQFVSPRGGSASSSQGGSEGSQGSQSGSSGSSSQSSDSSNNNH